MTKAKQGDKVKVHYQGKLEDGTIFDSSYEKTPLEFTIGEGSIITGFEDSVIGMDEGEAKNVHIPTQEAYGEYNDKNQIQVERSNLPQDIQPEMGMVLQVNTENQENFYVRIIDLDDQSVTLDANHPLAGKDLYFDIELLEVEAS